MNIDDIFPNGLAINDAWDLLWPLAVYIAGLGVYAIFVFKFYRFVASRDMFELDVSRYQESRLRWVRAFLHVVFYLGKYILLFPIIAFFWFAVLTLILTFLSKDQTFADVLLVAMAVVGSIRVTAYYNEDLSKDLAKILPFAVLGIFLVDASFFTVSASLDVLKEADDNRENVLYYLAFLIVLEFALRFTLAVLTFLSSMRDRRQGRKAPAVPVPPVTAAAAAVSPAVATPPAHETVAESPPVEPSIAEESQPTDEKPENNGTP